MAAKRASPLDNPPAASSSDEDVESSSEEEEEEQKGKQQQTNPTEEEVEDDEEEEESEDDDEEEGESEHKPEKKNQSLLAHTHKNPSVKIPKPQSSSSNAEGDDDDGSESESYSAQNMKSPGASDFTIKPVDSKHMNAVGKPKTATSKPAINKPAVNKPAVNKPAVNKPAATPSKRPTPESSLPNGKASKSKKPKGSNNEEEEVVAVEKKASISRLWSEDDEIAILKGMLDFQTEKGMDPNSDSAAFHEFIKSSLSVDVTRNQLMDKGRRMKRKFKNNVERGKNGKDPVFSKPHEQKSFALSKKIWGSSGYTKNNNNSDAAEENAKSSSRNATWKSNKANNNNAGVDATLSTHKEEAIVTQDQGKAKAEHEERKSELVELYPFFADLLRLHAFPNMHLGELGMKFSEKRLTSRGKPMLKALEDKCRKLKVAESELLLERLQLVKEGTSLVMDLIKSPEH